MLKKAAEAAFSLVEKPEFLELVRNTKLYTSYGISV